VGTGDDAGAAGGDGRSSIPERAYVYLGGSHDGKGTVALYSFSYATGELTLVKTVSVGQNCSFLALDKTNHALYATDDGGKRIRRLAIDPTTWEPAIGSERPSSGSPVHVSVTADGKLVLTAQWIQGTVEAFSVSEGTLGTSLGSRSACAQAHEVALAPQEDYVFVPCQTDSKINRYKLDATSGTLSDPVSTATASGAGPRHLAFAPNGQFAYLVNELDSTVYVYSYAAGALTELQRITTLPDGSSGMIASAEIALVPSGKYVYASNRPKAQDGTIAQFRVGPDGKLTANGHQSTGGQTPRSFAIDPTGGFVIAGNVDSSSVAVLAVDDASGKLGPARVTDVGFSPWSVVIVVP
jgi:6-phosphogluconolactonase